MNDILEAIFYITAIVAMIYMMSIAKPNTNKEKGTQKTSVEKIFC